MVVQLSHCLGVAQWLVSQRAEDFYNRKISGFFNVMVSGGLHSSIYITIHSLNKLFLCIGHNSYSNEHLLQITCYAIIWFYGIFVLVEIFSPSFNPGFVMSELCPSWLLASTIYVHRASPLFLYVECSLSTYTHI